MLARALDGACALGLSRWIAAAGLVLAWRWEVRLERCVPGPGVGSALAGDGLIVGILGDVSKFSGGVRWESG